MTSATLARDAVPKCVAKKKKEEEEEKRQAVLRRAQDQLKKCLEDEDYMGAAALKENIATLMSAEPCSQQEEKRQAELLRAQEQLKKIWRSIPLVRAEVVPCISRRSSLY